MNRSTSGLPVHPHSWSSPKPMSIESVMPSNHLIICHPLLLLASIFPSIRVFSNKSALRIYFLLFCIYHTNPDLMTFTNFFGINNDSFIISFNPSFFMACSLFITLLYLLHSSFCHTLPRIPQATASLLRVSTLCFTSSMVQWLRGQTLLWAQPCIHSSTSGKLLSQLCLSFLN